MNLTSKQFWKFILYSLKIILSALLVFVITNSCQQFHDNRARYTVWLDSLPFREIVLPYGPPKRNKSFSGHDLRIGTCQYSRGLGTHAPSEIRIDVNGKAKKFEAIIGIDSFVAHYLRQSTRDSINRIANYVYDNKTDHYDYSKGSTVVFEVLADGKTIFESQMMKRGDEPDSIEVNLSGTKTLTLIVKPTDDGSFTDHANWAMAKLVMIDSADLSMYYYPDAIMVNHAGFPVNGIKTCYMHSEAQKDFEIINVQTNTIVFEGQMKTTGGDFGNYVKGDFTTFQTPGQYFIKSGAKQSAEFEISDSVYDKCLSKHLTYITLQRSGHQEKGWAPGQHLDDGVRQDNGKYQDVTGGWYDACDIRKPAEGNAQLLYALALVLESENEFLPRDSIIEEIKWGNTFLFSMIEPAGYLMHYIGSTWEGYEDNRWTDNIVGSGDERTIITRPAQVKAQLYFIIAELLIAESMEKTEPAYADKCLQKARNAYEWLIRQEIIETTTSYAMAVTASNQMFKEFQDSIYLRHAEKFIRKILSRQIMDTISDVFYFLRSTRYMNNHEGGYILKGLADFVTTHPDHQLKDTCISIIKKFTDHFYLKFFDKNAFSLVPWLFSEDTLRGGKQTGHFWYRYFIHVGLNRHIASDAMGLLSAHNISGDKRLLEMAQNQLDWIYGANPFNASTVTGIGYNQPTLFKTGAQEFKPHTPLLTGGVMTGFGSDAYDNPTTYPGWWWTTEYWSPTVMATIVLVNKLNNKYQKQ